MRKRTFGRGAAMIPVLALLACAQTAVDGRSQAKNIDFANQTFTRPNKTGASLPSTCNTGETFFLTSAQAGTNLHLCIPDNTWKAAGGGITASPNHPVSFTSQTVVYIAHNRSTKDILVVCFDQDDKAVEPALTQTVDSNTVLVAFARPQSGRCIVNTASGGIGSGIANLNGQTGTTQTFTNDTNVTVSSAADSHTLSWLGTLAVPRGGTGASTAPSARQNLLPSYAGNGNKCLALNSGASDTVWTTCGSGGITSLNGQTGTTQTFTNDTNVTVSSAADSHTLGWLGTLAVPRGGTGASTAPSARQNLLPSYAGNGNKCLALNSGASDTVWTTCVSSPGITSLNGLTGTTQTFTNETNLGISSSGSTHTLIWSGSLAVVRGGTGATNSTAARGNLLPSYVSNSGKCLAVNTSSTDVEWVTCASGGSYTAGLGIQISGNVISAAPETAQQLFGTAGLDFPSIAADSCQEMTFTLTGATATDTLAVGWPATLENGLVGMARVGTSNQIVIRLCNVTGSAIDPAIGSFAVRIVKSF